MRKTTETLQDFQDYLTNRRGLRPGSVRKYKFAILAYLKSGMAPEDWAVDGPESTISLRRGAVKAYLKFTGQAVPEIRNSNFQVKPPEHRTTDEVKQLLELIRMDCSHREYFAALTIYCLGLRVGELRNLQIREIHLQAGHVRILNSKRGRHRVVPLLTGYLEPLKDWLKVHRHQFAKDHSGDWLMLSNGGYQWYERDLNRAIKDAAEKLGFGGVHTKPAHWLRHMCATHLHDAGADMRSLQLFLGHQSITTTQLYVQVSAEHLQAAIQGNHPLNKVVEPANVIEFPGEKQA